MMPGDGDKCQLRRPIVVLVPFTTSGTPHRARYGRSSSDREFLDPSAMAERFVADIRAGQLENRVCGGMT